jgi:hypothetical protein
MVYVWRDDNQQRALEREGNSLFLYFVRITDFLSFRSCTQTQAHTHNYKYHDS